jgi:hypothetical protein
MSYNCVTYTGCNCLGDKIVPLPVQCVGCNGSSNSAETQEMRQKRMWGLVRTSSSIFTMNLAALSVRGTKANYPKQVHGNVNWNQMSDRAVPSVIPGTMNVPRHRTKLRPGATGTGGVKADGVDVKHDSYARYLARKKAANLKTIKTNPLPEPLYGNKQYSLGMLPGCAQCAE